MGYVHSEIYDPATGMVVACTLRVGHDGTFGGRALAGMDAGSMARLTIDRMGGALVSRPVWG